MAIVAQESRIGVCVTYAVRKKVERVGIHLPAGQNDCHVVVDRHIRVFINDVADSAQVPTLLDIEWEGREVERLGRRDHEEVAGPGVFIHDPTGRLGKYQAVVPAPDDEGIGPWVLREDEGDLAVRVDTENRTVRVVRRTIVDPYFVSTLHDGFVASIQPDARLKRVDGGHVGLPGG